MRKPFVVMMFAMWMVPLAAAGTINFEVTDAPSLFRDTTALRDLYAGQGVIFGGPDINDGGAIVNQLGNFGLNAHSGMDFLAFNIVAVMHDGGIPRGPETINFSSPVFNVGLWVGGSVGSPSYTLEAFDEFNGLIGSESVTPDLGTWSQLTINTSEISRLVLSIDGSNAVVDDLTWGSTAPSVPEPSTLGLLGAGLAMLIGAASRRRK